MIFTATLILIFGFVVAFGAPYLPTLKGRMDDIFTLLDLKPGQRLLELGSGDGRVLLAAAKKGIYATGYELNPLLVIWSKLVTWRYRHLVRVHWGNFWQAAWPQTEGVYVFLLDRYMKKLDNKIIQESAGKVKLVSYGFKVPHKKIAKKRNGLFLYNYN